MPWIGGADDDDLIERFKDLDPNSRDDVVKAARADLEPGYRDLSERERISMRKALADASSGTDYEIERLWNSIFPPFSLPDNKPLLFKWLDSALDAIERDERV
jgi:hypothetical protein